MGTGQSLKKADLAFLIPISWQGTPLGAPNCDMLLVRPKEGCSSVRWPECWAGHAGEEKGGGERAWSVPLATCKQDIPLDPGAFDSVINAAIDSGSL